MGSWRKCGGKPTLCRSVNQINYSGTPLTRTQCQCLYFLYCYKTIVSIRILIIGIFRCDWLLKKIESLFSKHSRSQKLAQ